MTKILLKGSAPHLSYRNILNELSIPYLMLNLPYSCNYRCLKCCNITDFPVKKTNNNTELSLNEIFDIIEDSSDSGFQVLIIAGEGEPLIDKNFKQIIKYAYQSNLIPYVFTNGSLLNSENIDFLAKHKVSIIISMDSLKADRYRMLTNNGNINKVLNNIENLRKVYLSLQEETNFGKIVSIAINTVVTQINFDEVKNIKHFCGDDIVFVCNQPSQIGLADNNWNSLFETDDIYNKVTEVINYHSKENGPLGSTSDGKWCAYLKNGVSIGYDGSILGCAYSIESNGFFGKYQKGKLFRIHEKVIDSIEQFYNQHGHSRCLLRHPKYNEWIHTYNSVLKLNTSNTKNNENALAITIKH